MLAAFGVFAIGYLVRPIGGAVIGHIGDCYGRRTALTVSVTAMAVPTFLMGLLPGYETLGLLAPIALVLLRMIQGLSVGGEYTSSMVFLVERAPADHRGLMGAVTCCGTTLGILIGSGVGATIAATMTTETLDAWGWRIPFLLGIVVGIVGVILRRHVSRGGASGAQRTQPDRRDLARSLATGRAASPQLSVFNAVSFYVMFVYVASWLQTADGISPAHALEINTISMMILLPALLASGWLSDRFGRKPSSNAVNRARGRCRPAAVLGHVSPFPGTGPVGTDGLRSGDRPLWRHAVDDDGRIRAVADSLYRGGARPQCVPWQ